MPVKNNKVTVVRPFTDKDGETFYEAVVVDESDVSANDESVREESDGQSFPAFAVTRSDFVRLLRGDTLTYGPLRRTISIQDGPFTIIEGGAEPKKILPPEPDEFRQDEADVMRAEYVYAQIKGEMEDDSPSLNERIRSVLKSFVDRVQGVFRGGEGSGHHGHRGRPGEVGGSLPGNEGAFADVGAPVEKKKLSPADKTAYRVATHWVRMNFQSNVEGSWLRSTQAIPEEEREARPFVYFSVNRPVSAIARIPGDVRFNDRTIWSAEPLPFETIRSMELAAFSPEAVGDIAKRWYEEQIGETGTYVFADTMQMKGFVVHPSTDPDRGPWRATTFEDIGFTGHDYYPTVEKAIADNISLYSDMGGYAPAPSFLESLVKTEEFQARSVDDDLVLTLRGGPGSGFVGHQGRPGEVGGSLPRGAKRMTRDRAREIVAPFKTLADAEHALKKMKEAGTHTVEALHEFEEAVRVAKKAMEIDWLSVPDETIQVVEPDIDRRPLTKKAINEFIQWSTSRYNEYPKKYVVDTAYEMMKSGEDEHGHPRWVFSTGGFTPSSNMTGSDYLINGPEKYIAVGIGDYHDMDAFKEFKRVYFGDQPVERGGPGSGHHGHSGRPGEVGGSLPGDGAYAPSGRSLTQLLRVPKTDRWNVVRKTIDAVDKVHVVSETLRGVKLRAQSNITTDGQYRWSMRTGPIDMSVNLPSEWDDEEYAAKVQTNMAHEIGHWLDHMMLGAPGRFGSVEYIQPVLDTPDAEALAAWREAVKGSRAYKELLDFPAGTTSTGFIYDQGFLDRALTYEELFARSYAQWIALKSGDGDMRDSVTKTVAGQSTDETAPLQWEWDDFQPVAEAIDEIFRSRKWLKE